jgi:hypothetical protein
MTDGPAPDPPTAEPGGDYGYDMAHEAGGFDTRSEGTAHEDHAPVYVATETTDTGQDYSYDLAHDIPPPPDR